MHQMQPKLPPAYHSNGEKAPHGRLGEMCETYAFKARMEDREWFNAIRQVEPKLPPAYHSNGEKAAQGRLILNLVSQNSAGPRREASRRGIN